VEGFNSGYWIVTLNVPMCVLHIINWKLKTYNSWIEEQSY